MSARYVWSRSGGEEYIDRIPDVLANPTAGWSGDWRETIGYIPKGTFSGNVSTLDQPTCYKSYTFNKTTGKYSGSGGSTRLGPTSGMVDGVEIQSRIGSSDVYPYIISPDGNYVYFWAKIQPYVTSDDSVFWTHFVIGKNSSNITSSSAENAVCVSMIDQDSDRYDYYALEFTRVKAVVSTGADSKVSSGNSNAYSGIEYTYLGSDSIDPISIYYQTSGVTPGDKITITVTPASNTYGGTISYQYQYNTGSGWVTIQTTTSTSIQFDIPSNANSIQFRVRAQDSWGFISDDYVTGPTIYFEGEVAGRIWIGVGNTAKQATGVWVGVNGVAKKVKAMWVGVNGIAKKVF